MAQSVTLMTASRGCSIRRSELRHIGCRRGRDKQVPSVDLLPVRGERTLTSNPHADTMFLAC